ncbi:hypothetical protein BN996_02538 [Haloferax massiliensis]|uniref:Uncharacterized protein n=1 Tax=Haloferax massiliensis TaxID=1476858 RepID=A0A0D6JT09_9EURY|nr:hypothetical protein BN996_02538 [Haloferax massiliensis]
MSRAVPVRDVSERDDSDGDAGETDGSAETAADEAGEVGSPALSVTLGGGTNVAIGAAMAGYAAFSAGWTLAVRASGDFPDDNAVGGLLTLLVFAGGVAILVDGAAGVFAEKRDG